MVGKTVSWVATLCVLAAGCLTPTPPTSSLAPTTPAPTTAAGCGMVGDAAVPDAWFSENLSADLPKGAQAIASQFGDSNLTLVAPKHLDPANPPTSAAWSSRYGQLSFVTSQSGDSVISGLYWPDQSWAYFRNQVWPSRDTAVINRTMAAIVTNLTGAAPPSLHMRSTDEPADHELEVSAWLSFGDLRGITFLTGTIHYANRTTFTMEPPVLAAPGFTPLPAATLQATALAYGACWARERSNATLVVGKEDTRLVNGTLVEEFGMRNPARAGQDNCSDGKVMAVFVDAAQNVVRATRLSTNFGACLGP
ncbi:MAG: hypothetical protein ACYDBQ_03085 [Thermoplasmatota archaeon]